MHVKTAALLITATVIAGCAAPKPPEPPPAPAPAVTVEAPAVPQTFSAILFAPASVQLSAENRHLVREIADALKAPSVSSASVRVAGHTDNRGSERSNEEVGMRRAKAVAQELIFNGVAPERLLVESLGESQPVAPNVHADGSDNPEGRALNRRVEVVITN